MSKELEVVDSDDLSTKLENNEDDCEIFFKEDDYFELNNVDIENTLTLNGEHLENPVLELQDSSFCKITIKNFEDVLIGGCSFNKDDLHRSALNVYECGRVIINDIIMKENNNGNVDIFDSGISTYEVNTVKIYSSLFVGCSTVFMFDETDVILKDILVKDSDHVLEITDCNIEIFNVDVENFKNILSPYSSLRTCDFVEIKDSPEFIDIIIERL